MKRLILLTLLFSLSATTYSSAQTEPAHKERLQAIYNGLKTTVQSKKFTFVGTWVFNNKKRAKLDNDKNTLTLTETNANGQLSALGAEDKFTTVKGEISNYKASYDDDKQQIAIEFQVNGKRFYFDIKQSGRVFLTLKSNGLEITQLGEIRKN